MYIKAEASFWTAEEIDLTIDLNDWDSLTNNERYFVSHIFTFFAASDGIVNEKFGGVNFAVEVQSAEARCFYGFQIAVENIHSETYLLLVDTYIQDQKEKAHLLSAIETVPCVHKKAYWSYNYVCGPTSCSFMPEPGPNYTQHYRFRYVYFVPIPTYESDAGITIAGMFYKIDL